MYLFPINPINIHHILALEANDDTKFVESSKVSARVLVWDDEITGSKVLFLDSHRGLCPVDKKIWRAKLNLWLMFMLLGLSYTHLTYSKLNLLDRLDGV